MRTALFPVAVRGVLVAVFLCFSVSSALQATPPPTPVEYSAVPVPSHLRNVSATGTFVPLDPEQPSGAIALPFPFTFYGAVQTELFIGPNGFVTFQTGENGCCAGGVIPSDDGTNNLIAGYWDDLTPGNVRYETRGAAPSREFIVGFYDVPHYPEGPNVTFEIVLHETTNAIELQYGDAPSDGGIQTAGVENADGTIGLEIAHGSVSFNNQGFLITRHAPTASIALIDGDACPLRVEMTIGDDQEHPLSGAVNVYAAANAYPDGLSEIRLEMLHTSCGSTPPMTLSLNSTVVESFSETVPQPGQPAVPFCSCHESVETRTYTDPAALSAWMGGGATNVLTLSRTDPAGMALLSWARVVLSGPGQPDRTYCLSGSCSTANICDGFRTGDFQMTRPVEADLSLVSSTPYADSTLPVAASLAGMTSTAGVFELVASDGVVQTTARMEFTRPDACTSAAVNVFNTPPTAVCQDVTVAADPVSCTAPASVDNGSSDAEGPVTLAQSPAGPFGLGFTPVTLTATDADGVEDSCPATVQVVDATAPVVSSASATPNTLWPPNGQMVPVTVDVSLADACDPGAHCEIASVTSSEPSATVDWEVTGPLTLNLRAKRAGGTNRVYSVNLRCADASGNETLRTVEVNVPRTRP